MTITCINSYMKTVLDEFAFKYKIYKVKGHLISSIKTLNTMKNTMKN